MNYCPKCGKQLAPREKFCSNCGQRLVENESVVTTNPVNPVDSVASKMPAPLVSNLKSKKGFMIIGIIVVALFLYFNIGKQSASDVAKEFIQDTQEENYDQAQALWSQTGIDYMLSQLGDERWIYQSMRNFTHRTDGDLDDFQITNEQKVDDKMTKVTATFIFTSGKRSDAELEMVKENGKWKVYAFDSE